MYKVVYHYEATSPSDISLNVGDKITSVKDVGNGWVVGYNKNSGETGVFPGSYINFRKSLEERLSIRAPKPGRIVSRPLDLPPKPPVNISATKTRKPKAISFNDQSTRTTEPADSTTNAKPLKDQGPSIGSKWSGSTDVLFQATGKLFKSGRGEYRARKAVVGVLFALLFGGVLCITLHYGFDYNLLTAGCIAGGSILIMAPALAFSVRCRCIGTLMVPSFCTGKGRVVFLSIILGMILSGPVTNITFNSRVAVKSMACIMDIVRNQSASIQEQLNETFQNAAQQLQERSDVSMTVKDIFSTAENGLTKAHEWLSDKKDLLQEAAEQCAKDVTRIYTGCQEGINKATTDCDNLLSAIDRFFKEQEMEVKNFVTVLTTDIEEAFKELGSVFDDFLDFKKRRKRYSHQHDTIISNYSDTKIHRVKRNWVQDICQTLNHIGAVCEAFNVKDTICKGLEELYNLLAEGVAFTEKILQIIKNFFVFDVRSGGGAEGVVNSSTTAEQIQEKVLEIVQKKFDAIMFAISIFNNVLSASVLLLLLQSFWYLRSYLSKDAYDNIYITTQFRHFDQQCDEQGKPCALPLKTSESSEYVDVRSFTLCTREYGYCTMGLALVIIHIVSCFIVNFLDYMIFYVLSVIREHSNLSVEVSGESKLQLTIEGSGILALILREMIKGITLDQSYNATTDVSPCLPQPLQPSYMKYYVFALLYFVCLLIVFLQAYAMRLRRQVAAFFYPEQEAARIKYLQKSILHKRASFLKFMRQHVKSMHKAQRVELRMSFFPLLRYKFPTITNLCFKDRAMCLSCGAEEEDKRFEICMNRKCNAIYCLDCFADMKQCCAVCAKDEIDGVELRY